MCVRKPIGHRIPHAPNEIINVSIPIPAASGGTMSYAIIQPRSIHLGRGALMALEKELIQRNPEKILVVTETTMIKIGIAEQVFQHMGAYRNRIEIFFNPSPNPDIGIVKACASKVRDGSFDLIVGIGGGSPMDVAKAASVVATHEEDVTCLLGKNLLKREGIPLILIPTTSGTGTEVTQAAVMEDPRVKSKKSIWDPRAVPAVAIVDSELTRCMPPSLTAITAFDALFHGIEGFTAKTTNPIAQMYCLEAIRLIAKNLRRAYRDGADMDARDALSRASVLAGIGFSNSGLGADSLPGFAHGQELAILGPWIMNFNRKENESIYAIIAEALGESVDGQTIEDASLQSCRAIQRLSVDVGIASHLRKYGVKKADIPAIAKNAYQLSQRLMPMNIRPMTEMDVLNIFQVAYDGSLS
jgi:alcohol dehydrogenase class IV